MPKGVPKDLRPAARIFAAYLAKACRGREAAKPKYFLLPELRRAGADLSARDFDRLAALAVDLGLAVGTSGRGYFWCEMAEDFALAHANLVTRFGPMRRHDQGLLVLWHRAFPDEPLWLVRSTECRMRVKGSPQRTQRETALG
jgi:hypothetical protein